MDKILKGSKIKNNKLGTFHVVESVEVYDDVTLVYTEDIKCFPSSDVEITISVSKKLCDLFYSWFGLNKEIYHPDKETTDELERLLKSDYTVEMINEDFDKMLQESKVKK